MGADPAYRIARARTFRRSDPAGRVAGREGLPRGGGRLLAARVSVAGRDPGAPEGPGVIGMPLPVRTKRPIEPRVGRCAACGCSGCLVRCGGCDWSDRVLAARAQRLLATVSPSTAPQAYRHDGCRVCAACRERFGADMRSCPLRVLARGALCGGGTPVLVHGHLCHLAALLGEELRQRGEPPITEVYWVRLLRLIARVCRYRSQSGEEETPSNQRTELREAHVSNGCPRCPRCATPDAAFLAIVPLKNQHWFVMHCLTCGEYYRVECPN
jgi:hypothetical protein